MESGEKWGKVIKSGEKWKKVAKVRKNGRKNCEKWRTVANSS